jgi:hypothetical protein
VKRAPTSALAAVCLLAVCSLAWSFRVVCPYPTNYVTRLEWLNGAPTQGMIALDCVGFIANAKGVRAPWGAVSQFDLPARSVIAEYPSKNQVDESKLMSGDIAQFYDADGPVHVIAFLRPGVWIDADYRRGNVSKFNLATKPMTDEWFSGRVRIMRWK